MTTKKKQHNHHTVSFFSIHFTLFLYIFPYSLAGVIISSLVPFSISINAFSLRFFLCSIWYTKRSFIFLGLPALLLWTRPYRSNVCFGMGDTHIYVWGTMARRSNWLPARTRKSGRPGSPGHCPAAAPDIHRWGAGYPRGLFQYNHPGPSPQ